MYHRGKRVGRALGVCAVIWPPYTFAAADYQIQRIASGLNQPTYVTQAPGDPANVIYYTTRITSATAGFSGPNSMGKVYRYDVNTRTSTVVLDLSARSVTQDDGLQTIAFSPDYNNVGTAGYQKLYVSSSTTGTSPLNKVEEYTVPSGGTATFSRTILQYSNTGTNYNNHTVDYIGFDPSATGAARNYLYISTGDGNFGNSTRPSQNPSDMQGKILRVDVAGADAYPADPNKNFAIPAANPIPTYNAAHPGAPVAGLGEMFVTGLRNPSRLSFDRSNGNLFIGDVGESAQEEVDFIKAGSTGASGLPIDFGWPAHEGTANGLAAYSPYSSTNSFTGVTSTNPIQQFAHVAGGNGGNAVIGGYVYHGPIASLQGKYFFADFVQTNDSTVRPQIESLDFDPNTNPAAFNGNNGTLTDLSAAWNSSTMLLDPTDPTYTPSVGAAWGLDHIVSFGEDNAGNMYIVDFGSGTGFQGEYPVNNGEIFRVTATPEPATGLLLCYLAGSLANRVRRRNAR